MNWHYDVDPSVLPKCLFTVGVAIDLYSSFCGISAVVKKRNISGLPGFGFFFMSWAWLGFPESLLISTPTALILLWAAKLLDLFALFVLSMGIIFIPPCVVGKLAGKK